MVKPWWQQQQQQGQQTAAGRSRYQSQSDLIQGVCYKEAVDAIQCNGGPLKGVSFSVLVKTQSHNLVKPSQLQAITHHVLNELASEPLNGGDCEEVARHCR
jgi:hypothetical protein